MAKGNMKTYGGRGKRPCANAQLWPTTGGEDTTIQKQPAVRSFAGNGPMPVDMSIRSKAPTQNFPGGRPSALNPKHGTD